MSHATPSNAGARRGRDAFLAFIILLLVVNLGWVAWGLGSGRIRFDDPRSVGCGSLVVGLMVLLNHLAFQYPRPGWKGKALKALAVTWLALGTGYIVYLLVPP